MNDGCLGNTESGSISDSIFSFLGIILCLFSLFAADPSTQQWSQSHLDMASSMVRLERSAFFCGPLNCEGHASQALRRSGG